MTQTSWRRIDRKLAYDNPRVKVYEDKVELPTGTIIDYTVVKKKDGVYVVATDKQERIIILDEYKYAIDQVVRTLPAGGLEEGEDPVVCAVRELAEETGYVGQDARVVTTLHEYPTKDMHTFTIVRITNANRVSSTHLEETEELTTHLLSKEQVQIEVRQGKWKSSGPIAALAVCGLI